MNLSLRRSLIVGVGCAIAFAAGCGSDDTASTEPIIVVETSPTTSGSAPSSASASADSSSDVPAGSAVGETDEEKLAAFSQCMRDNGVESFVDPVIQADGSANLFADEAEAQAVTTDPEFNTAYEGCLNLLQGTSFLAGQSQSEAEDDLVKLAACLRERGIEVDDPNFDAADPNDVFGSDLDPNDPAVDEAVNACSAEIYTDTSSG